MQEIPVSSLDPRLQKQLENAQVALQRGNADYVIEVTAQVLKNAPGCVPVRRLQRVAQVKKAQSKSKLFTKAFGSMTQAGFMFGSKKDPAKGIENAEKMLAVDPNNVSALKLLAESAAALEMPETVCFAWESVREVQPTDHDTLLSLGEAYLAANKHKEALRVADDLLRTKPQDGDALALMRRASVAQTMDKGKWEEEGTFREKLRDEEQAVSLEQAAKVVTSSEMTERLIAEAKHRVEAEPDNLNHYRSIIDGYRKLNRFPDALEWLRKARKLPSGAGDSGLEKLEGDLEVAVIEDEVHAAQAKLAESPENAAAQSALEAAKAKLTSFRLAQSKAYVERYPNDYAARYTLANLHFEAGEYQEAIANYQQAQKNPKVRISALAGMGKALKARKMFDIAVAQFQTAKSELASMDDTKKDVIYQLASCYEAMGKTQEAINEYKLIYSEDIGFRDVSDKINAFYASN